jgi:type 1 glutamine amidotransferase
MHLVVRTWIVLILTGAVASVAAKPLHIGYLYGQKEYDGEGGLRALAGMMETHEGARTTYFAGADIATDTSEATAFVLPNIDALDSLDVLVIFVRRLWLNKAQLAKLKSFLNSGKGIVGIRSAQYAIQSWDEGFGIDTAVLGGAYNGHGSTFGYDLEFTAVAKQGPIFSGINLWKAGDKLYHQDYKGKTLASDCNILAYGIQGDVRMPVAWTRVRMGSNIFVTTAGVQEDFRNPEFRKMIVKAVLWAGKSPATTGLTGPQGRATGSETGKPAGAIVPGFRYDGRRITGFRGAPLPCK